MRYRTVICVLVALVVGALLLAACGFGLQSDEPGVETEDRYAPLVSNADMVTNLKSSEEAESKESSVVAAKQDASVQEAVTGAPDAHSYDEYTPGETSLEERILLADAIAVVELEHVIGTYRQIVSGDRASEYMTYLEVTYRVEETLKGDALPKFITVEVFVLPYSNTELYPVHSYGTSDEARTAAQTWYDNNPVFPTGTSIVFLKTLANSETAYDIARPRTRTHPLYVFLGKSGYGDGYIMPWGGLDTVTIDGTNKVVLPMVTWGTGDSRAFYLDSPPSPTMALSSLEAKITDVDNMVDDSIPGHRRCIRSKFVEERNGKPKLPEFLQSVTHEWVSGQPAGTVLNERDGRSDLTGYMRYELGGPAAEYLSWEATDNDSDPSNGYKVELKNNRPLPAGTYDFHYRVQYGYWKPCGHISRTASQLIMRMVKGKGVLHELFFDPVTAGSAISADSTNGLIKPVLFTDANSTSATIQRIAWESGMVEIEVTPNDALIGHIVDFIELDGAVSLSLDVADATVDAAKDRLSWSVSEQPWHDGDKLMVRIREG